MPEIEQSQVVGLEQVHFQTVRSKKMAIFNTSSTELKHLFIAWVAISYAFAIVIAWMELDPGGPRALRYSGRLSLTCL